MSHLNVTGGDPGNDPPRRSGRVPEPPFSAASLKYSALDHARQYQSHFGGDVHIPSTGFENDMNTSEATHLEQTINPDVAVSSGTTGNMNAEQRVIRGLLFIDAQRLVESSRYLENLLQEGREWKNFLHALLAASCQVLLQLALQGRYVRQKLGLRLPFWLSWIPYSIAGWYIIKNERGISCTNAVKQGAEQLCSVVEAGEPLHKPDMDCFIGSEWYGAPWKKMEPRWR